MSRSVLRKRHAPHILNLRDDVGHMQGTNILTLPSHEEVRYALFSMKPYKAPSPDGYHPIFFQKTWEITGGDVVRHVQEWFGRGCISEELGYALICLIPRQNSLEMVKHFRPISLCNTLYKVVTKVLVNRLKPLIPKWN